MRLYRLGAGLVLALAVAAPAPAAPPNKNAGPAPVDADNLPAGKYVGKLLTTPGTDGTFTLQIEYPQVKPNPKARNNPALRTIQRDLQQIQRQEQQMLRSRNPQQMMQHMQSINRLVMQIQQQQVRAQANLFIVTRASVKVNFHAAEDVKVRIKNLPLTFDDKGNPRKYTAEERKELKGADKNLPGYESSLANLQQGQILEVTLAKKKAPSKSSVTTKDKEAVTDKELDKIKDPGPEHKMLARMIVIVRDVNDPGPSSPGKRK